MHVLKLDYFFKLLIAFVKRSTLGLCMILGSSWAPVSYSETTTDTSIEYQVKTAFIYNFIAFTKWPPGSVDRTISLCIHGEDFFGNEIDKLQSRPLGKRDIRVLRVADAAQLIECDAVFFSKSVGKNLSAILDGLQNRPILTLADYPSAISQGVAINMSLVDEKIVFEINLGIARKSGLDFSAKLLQLAVKVYQ